jgi:hypothetical protein
VCSCLAENALIFMKFVQCCKALDSAAILVRCLEHLRHARAQNFELGFGLKNKEVILNLSPKNPKQLSFPSVKIIISSVQQIVPGSVVMQTFADWPFQIVGPPLVD